MRCIVPVNTSACLSPKVNVTFYVKDRKSFKTDKNMEVWNETEECVNCCERY